MIADNTTLLFQGDSITNVHRMPEETNLAFRLGSGYPLLIAAPVLHARPRCGITFENRGVSGNTLRELHERWQVDALDIKPDVLSLLVGVNDAVLMANDAADYSAQTYDRLYRELLDRSLEINSALVLIMMEPFVLPVTDRTRAWEGHCYQCQTIVPKIAKDYGALFVPLQERFNAACDLAPAEHWLYDGVHPAPAGQWLIAQAWLDATGVLA